VTLILPPVDRLLLTLVATVLVCIVVGFIASHSASRIIRSVEGVGANYEALYREHHREVMDQLKGETQKSLAATRVLLAEHTELSRTLRMFAMQKLEEDAVVAQTQERTATTM
jgi:hypothetical protein